MAKFLNRNLRIETGKKVIMGDSAESFLKYDGSDLLINVDAAQVLQLNSTTQILGLSGDTNIELNQTNNTVIIEAANAPVGTFDADGLTLASGASINEFSTDETLVGDSDDAVPTEKAVKTYVDNAIGGAVDHNSTTGLQGGDSTTSEFYHLTQDIHDGLYSGSPIIGMGAVAGTNMEVDYGAHVVTVDINGSEVLDLTASTQRLGAAASAGKVEVGSASVDLYYSGNKTMTTSPDGISVQDGSGTSPSIFFKNDGGTTLFRIVANDTETNFQHWISSSPEDIMKATKNGAVELYYDNTKAFYTNSTGSVVRDGSGNNPALYLENSSDQTEARFRANTTSLFIEIGSSFENVFRANENGAVLLYYNDVSVFETTSDGIKLNLGAATINEFSIDGTLGDDSDTALPTEKAVKTYVDTEIANIATDQIIAGDSYVRVVDDGTAAGYIEVVADGTQVQYWDAQAATIRMGKASAAGRVVVNDTEVILSVGSLEYVKVDASSQVFGTLQGGGRFTTNSSNAFIHAGSLLDTELIFTATDTSQTLGVSGNTTFNLNQSTGTAIISTPGGTMLSVDGNVQRLGGSTDTFLSLTQNTNTVDLRAGNVSVLNATDTAQTFGVSGDASLVLNQTADTFVLAAGANTQISGGLTSLALGVAGDTTITLDQSADTVTITAGGESQVLVETSGTTITDDLTVSGDLFVDGTTWVVHNQEVTTSDNLIVINYGETGSGVTAGSAGFEIDRGQLTNYQFLFVEASDTFRIGEVGSLQAVATREDAPTDTRVPWWNDSAKRYDTAGSSSITINTSTDVIAFNAADGEVATLEADGLTLASGTNINEFSTDGTLAGDSDDAVPTEQAVKTYVDAQIGGSSNIIFEDDSYVKVTDDGTDVGWIEIVADGVQVAYFDPSAATQRIGKASSAGKVEVTDTAVELYYAGAKAMYTHVDGITVRDTNSTGPKLIFEDQNDITMGQIDCLANIIEMKVGSSLETVFKATINAAAELYYDNVKVFETTSDGIKLNLGAATINEFSTDGTLAGDSDTAVPTEKAVKLYVDTKVGTEVYSGIADIVNGDTTATVIFDVAQADADYTITTHIVNTTDLSPSLYVHMTTEYDENGFTEVFSGPMDSGNYKLHFVITRADQGV